MVVCLCCVPTTRLVLKQCAREKSGVISDALRREAAVTVRSGNNSTLFVKLLVKTVAMQAAGVGTHNVGSNHLQHYGVFALNRLH